MRKKTHDEYVSELAIKNPTIEVVGRYINKKTPILHHCLIHDVSWMASPSNILSGRGCNKCMREKISKALVKTYDKYIADLKIKNPSIEIVDDYINSSTPVMHHCLKHNIYWKISPNNVLNGRGCIECTKEKYQKSIGKTQEQYINDVFLINPDIEVIGQYINAYTPILHKCKIDGNVWYAKPDNILHGRDCPQCHESYGERQIRQWLNKNNIVYEPQKIFKDCYDIKPLPFDFYLPEHNVCIEYDGIQHFEPIEIFGGQKSLEGTVKHDEIKTEYCISNNIKLLRIPYFKDVEEELNNFLFI